MAKRKEPANEETPATLDSREVKGDSTKSPTDASGSSKLTCGIIRPISDVDGYPRGHWREVAAVIHLAAKKAGFTPRLVSESSDASIIQRTIVRNLYNDHIIVCDISSENANVMLELGMRLAFDKPVVIVKDDRTKSPFDTSIIEYVPYPCDLRHRAIQAFQKKLSEKIRATYDYSVQNEGDSQFLKKFGDFQAVKPEVIEAGASAVMAEQLLKLTDRVNALLVNQESQKSTGQLSQDGTTPTSLTWTLIADFSGVSPEVEQVYATRFRPSNTFRKDGSNVRRFLGHGIARLELLINTLENQGIHIMEIHKVSK